MAYAGALFADSCLRGLNGDSNVFDYSYVESDITDVPFFSSRVDLGPEGKALLCFDCAYSKLNSMLFHALRLRCSLPLLQCSALTI